MDIIGFDATTNEITKFIEPPKEVVDFAQFLWDNYRKDVLSMAEALELAPHDRKVYDALWELAVANRDDCTPEVKAALFDALVREPPRNKKGPKKHDHEAVLWAVAMLKERFPDQFAKMQTTRNEATDEESVASFMAEVTGIPERTLDRIL